MTRATPFQRIKSQMVNLLAEPLSRSYYLTQIARRIVQLYDNDGNGDMRSNGERLLLRRIVAAEPNGVIFDVGANKGDWSAEALALGFRGTIVMVDPLPRNVAALTRRFERDCNVHIAEYALSDMEGTSDFFTNADESESGTDSLYDMRTIGYAPSVNLVRVRRTTLDSLTASLGVSRISFLKVDVEGSELFVLRGAQDLLARGAVDFIQLEYGHAARAPRVYLHDLVCEAARHSFDTYVVKPQGIMRLKFTPFSDNRYSCINLLLARRPDVERLALPVLPR